ncbi:inositol monophosphatase family protein [Fulvimarina sp. MAC3]|uniref:3'(2'),5'-bisphosphate nucleotidase CysQ family protein n=1 Tax=Fulvimarina sp. MAC3 TaxID=3148887 RepID=UPI0031FD0AA9
MPGAITADIDPQDIILAVKAGMDAIMALNADVHVEYKDDASPVTMADRAAERAITAHIEARSSIPIVAEERFSAGRVPEIGDRFLLVDPLDGTKSYIAGKPDYTVNIAIVENGVPVFGCVGVPATGEIYSGGLGLEPTVERNGETIRLAVREAPERVEALVSRNHLSSTTKDYLDGLDIAGTIAIGSSLKLCLLAEGRGDLYPRFNRTMQWDTAAGHGVLLAAGGCVVTPSGEPFLYGLYGRTRIRREDVFANGFFIAVGDPKLLDRDGVIRRG